MIYNIKFRSLPSRSWSASKRHVFSRFFHQLFQLIFRDSEFKANSLDIFFRSFAFIICHHSIPLLFEMVDAKGIITGSTFPFFFYYLLSKTFLFHLRMILQVNFKTSRRCHLSFNATWSVWIVFWCHFAVLRYPECSNGFSPFFFLSDISFDGIVIALFPSAHSLPDAH